jgi:hypothetical protein
MIKPAASNAALSPFDAGVAGTLHELKGIRASRIFGCSILRPEFLADREKVVVLDFSIFPAAVA